MREIDVELDAEAARIRPQLAIGFAFDDADRLQDLDVAARRRQRDDAGVVDRLDERLGAAVHDRHFRPVDLDDRRCRCRDPRAPRARAPRSSRAGRSASPSTVCEFGCGDGAEVGAHFAVGLAADAAAHEHDAGVGFRGKNGEGRRQTGMHADTADRGLVGEAWSVFRPSCPTAMPQPKRLRTTRAHLRRIAAVPDFAKVAGEIIVRPKAADFPAKTGKSPLLANNLTRA